MEMTYLCQPPKRYTFEQPKLREWVENICLSRVPPEYAGQQVLNLFAGRTMLNIPEYRVDMDPKMPANVHMDSHQYVEACIQDGVKYAAVILDPPYNLRKAREKYEGRYIGKFTKTKNILSQILFPGAIVITLGYDTVGMSKSRGFEKIAVCVVCHGGDHNDTLVVVERKL